MLTNKELSKLILKEKEPILRHISDYRFNRSDSLVQPASIDLTVGQIWLPPDTVDPKKEPSRLKHRHVLSHGDTVMIETREELNLPDDISGLMFPKNGDFALKGLMITNFGHVDPGYKGKLRYTVINFGRDNYPIEEGQRITSLTLFKLDSAPNPTWSEISRYGSREIQGHVKALNRDFLDIENRIVKLVDESVNNAVFQKQRWRDFISPLSLAVVALVFTVSLAFAGIFAGYFIHLDNKITAISEKVNQE